MLHKLIGVLEIAKIFFYQLSGLLTNAVLVTLKIHPYSLFHVSFIHGLQVKIM